MGRNRIAVHNGRGVGGRNLPQFDLMKAFIRHAAIRAPFSQTIRLILLIQYQNTQTMEISSCWDNVKVDNRYKEMHVIAELTEGPTFPWGPASPGRPVRPCGGERQANQSSHDTVWTHVQQADTRIYTSGWAPPASSCGSATGAQRLQNVERCRSQINSHILLFRQYRKCSKDVSPAFDIFPTFSVLSEQKTLRVNQRRQCERFQSDAQVIWELDRCLIPS